MRRQLTSGHKVALALMKSPEAAATIDVLRNEKFDAITVVDHGTYWLVTADDEIRVEIDRVSEELGEPLRLSRWLVTLSSYVGRADPGADYFRVTSDMVELDGKE